MQEATSILAIHPRNGKVLGATRRGTTDQWGLIGGKVDPGETIIDAAMREFHEEAGIKLTSIPENIFERVCEAGVDGVAFQVAVFLIVDYYDLKRICDAFTEQREVEQGIQVGFIDYGDVIAGPFGDFNKDLLSRILKRYVLSVLE